MAYEASASDRHGRAVAAPARSGPLRIQAQKASAKAEEVAFRKLAASPSDAVLSRTIRNSHSEAAKNINERTAQSRRLPCSARRNRSGSTPTQSPERKNEPQT